MARRFLPVFFLAVLAGCDPLPYTIEDHLALSTIGDIQARYQGAPAIIVQLDEQSRSLTITQRSRAFLIDWFWGQIEPRIFPIGQTFAAYLEQAQRYAFRRNQHPPLVLDATITDATLSFTFSHSFFSTDYIDGVDLTLVIDTRYPERAPERISLHRAVKVKRHEVTYASIDRALTTALEQIVLDYLDAVVREAK